MSNDDKLVMRFDPSTIEHLGLRLYSTLPPVISELVSNAYDAESRKVEIRLPSGPITASSEVVVRDYGHSMDREGLKNEYLVIGRDRRKEDPNHEMSKSGKRRVTGRKGLGKLSVFGVARELQLTAYKAGKCISLRFNYDDMLRWARKHGYEEPYQPKILKDGATTRQKDGVEVRLQKLHRRKAISDEQVRRGLAKRLAFIGRGFDVLVNATRIQPGDRVQKNSCEDDLFWDVPELPGKGELPDGSKVTGWLGFTKGSSQTGRGVDIFAHAKAVELGSFFNSPTTHVQFARAYVVGEVHADFLDEEQDLIATARNSVVWESQQGTILQDWGKETLTWAFGKWLEVRRRKKETIVVKAAGFDKWLEGRLPSEQRVAQRMLQLLVNDPNIDPESAEPLLEIVKGSVEAKAFHELVARIEEEGASVSTFLALFKEWRVIEARAHLQVADGRREVIEKLETFIETGALEVQEIQPLFENDPWLLDPAWRETKGQQTYTKMLRAHCKEPKSLDEKNRRLDILGIRTSGELCVVELKRPEKTLSWDDLDQIERYVTWAKMELQSTSEAKVPVRGRLIVGKLGNKADVLAKKENLTGQDIRVETYRDLYTRACQYYDEVEDVLKAQAPEYARTKLKKARNSGK